MLNLDRNTEHVFYFVNIVLRSLSLLFLSDYKKLALTSLMSTLLFFEEYKVL